MRTKKEEKRQAILEIAAQAFRELGFERTSMSEIRTRVGGSKETLYNYFASKEELFFAVMVLSLEVEFDAAHRAIDSTSDDIAESLRHFGESFLSFLYSSEIQALRHLAISESKRTELGRVMYEGGFLRSTKLVSEFLSAQMDRGKLRQADPDIATLHLNSLLQSELSERFLFQVLGEVSPEEIKAYTDRAIKVFMAAYEPSEKPAKGTTKRSRSPN